MNSGIVGGFGGHLSLGAKDLADEIDKMNNKNDANWIIMNTYCCSLLNDECTYLLIWPANLYICLLEYTWNYVNQNKVQFVIIHAFFEGYVKCKKYS